MSAADGAGATRRERLRQQTYVEIVTVARQLIRDGNEASLRALAGELGMTPSALYRYVDSVADLHALITRSVYADVIQVMGEAAAPYGGDPAAQLAASATAFREWGLANVAEFRSIFAGLLAAGDTGPAENGSEEFAAYFAEIFSRLVESDLIRVPDLDTVDESLAMLITGRKRPSRHELIKRLGADGPGVLWLFQLAWARLYGVVILEALGLLDQPIIKSRALFFAVMRETFDSLGLRDDWNRLREISAAVVQAQHQKARRAGRPR